MTGADAGALHTVGIPGEGNLARAAYRNHATIAAEPADIVNEAARRCCKFCALIAHAACNVLCAARKNEIFAKPGAGGGDMFVRPRTGSDERRVADAALELAVDAAS